MYPCSVEKAEVIKLHVIQQNHLAFNYQISKAITKFGPGACLEGSQVFPPFWEISLHCFLHGGVCSKCAALHRRPPACRMLCRMPERRQASCVWEDLSWQSRYRWWLHLPSRLWEGRTRQVSLSAGVRTEPAFPFRLHITVSLHRILPPWVFLLFFPICSHDNLTQSKYNIFFNYKQAFSNARSNGTLKVWKQVNSSHSKSVLEKLAHLI